MASCEHCKKPYHACSSCGLVGWEWDFCGESCRSKFVESVACGVATKLDVALAALDPEQREVILHLLGDANDEEFDWPWSVHDAVMEKAVELYRAHPGATAAIRQWA